MGVPVSTDVVERIRTELVTGAGILKTAKALGVGTGTVHRVKREMGGCSGLIGIGGASSASTIV